LVTATMTSHQDPQTLAVRQGAVEAAATAINSDWGRFLSLHEFVRVELLAYLSINDLTNLSMVSHQFRDMVNSSVRTTYPHIIWEERLPTQIGCQPYDTSHSNYYPTIVMMKMHSYQSWLV
jgi:hypothetical protein